MIFCTLLKILGMKSPNPQCFRGFLILNIVFHAFFRFYYIVNRDNKQELTCG